MLRVTGIVFAAVLIAATSASAQDDKKVQFNVGGSFTGVYGGASSRVGNGGGISLGITFKASPVVALQGEYSYNGMQSKALTLPVSAQPLSAGVPSLFTAHANMQSFDFNLLLSPKVKSTKIAPYALTGLGVYYRPVDVTTPAVGFVTACDPYWYVCYPTPVAVENVVGSRSSTDFGMNIGGGVNFKLKGNASAYLQLSWHYVWGPTLDGTKLPAGSAAPTNLKATGKFLPITFGFRF